MKWTFCDEGLPPVYYDKLGNWSSVYCLLYFEDGSFDTGVFNPIGSFQDWEEDGPVWTGCPGSDNPHHNVIAWAELTPPKKKKEKNK